MYVFYWFLIGALFAAIATKFHIYNITKALSNIIFTEYDEENGEMAKGRAFGTKGLQTPISPAPAAGVHTNAPKGSPRGL